MPGSNAFSGACPMSVTPRPVSVKMAAQNRWALSLSETEDALYTNPRKPPPFPRLGTPVLEGSASGAGHGRETTEYRTVSYRLRIGRGVSMFSLLDSEAVLVLTLVMPTESWRAVSRLEGLCIVPSLRPFREASGLPGTARLPPLLGKRYTRNQWSRPALVAACADP